MIFMKEKEFAFNLDRPIGERVTFHIKTDSNGVWLHISDEKMDSCVEMQLSENEYKTLCEALPQAIDSVTENL